MLPHPCDRLRHHGLRPEILPEALPLIDLVEGFNGRTVFPQDDGQVVALGKNSSKLLTAGSDAHTLWEVGRCGVEMEDFQGPEEFLLAVRNGRFFGNHAPSGSIY